VEATSLDEEVVETVAETVTEAPVGTTRRLRSDGRLNALPTLRVYSGWSCREAGSRRAAPEEQAPEEQAQRRMPTMWYSTCRKSADIYSSTLGMPGISFYCH
jgi:hypothetical protein